MILLVRLLSSAINLLTKNVIDSVGLPNANVSFYLIIIVLGNVTSEQSESSIVILLGRQK